MQMRGKKEAFFSLTQSLETIRLFYLLKEGLEPSTAINKLRVCFNSFKKKSETSQNSGVRRIRRHPAKEAKLM